MSYGPGRYDPEYEERGHDYPLAYVRWTEKRNIEAFVELIGSGKLNVERLITHRFPIEDAERAYQLISGNAGESYLGVILNYDPERQVTRRVILNQTSTSRADKAITLGSSELGYVRSVAHFKTAGVLRSVTTSGVSAPRCWQAIWFGSRYRAPRYSKQRHQSLWWYSTRFTCGLAAEAATSMCL